VRYLLKLHTDCTPDCQAKSCVGEVSFETYLTVINFYRMAGGDAGAAAHPWMRCSTMLMRKVTVLGLPPGGEGVMQY
jgi:hypothetical protein